MRPKAGHSMMPIDAFNARSRSADSARKRVEADERRFRQRHRSGQAARSNIQAGTSSQRSASDPVNVQRKTTPSALSIAP